ISAAENDTYDPVQGTGVRGGVEASWYKLSLADPIIVVPATGADGASINVTIKQFSLAQSKKTPPLLIDTNARTWVVIHGRGDSADTGGIRQLANAIGRYNAAHPYYD